MSPRDALDKPDYEGGLHKRPGKESEMTDKAESMRESEVDKEGRKRKEIYVPKKQIFLGAEFWKSKKLRKKREVEGEKGEREKKDIVERVTAK